MYVLSGNNNNNNRNIMYANNYLVYVDIFSVINSTNIQFVLSVFLLNI